MIQKMIALDWLAMKYYQARGIFLPFAALLMGVVYTPFMVIPFLVIMGISFSINPFAVEEKGELNNLYLTLPLQRKQIVIGRYALSLLMLFVAIAFGIPGTMLVNTIAFFKCTLDAQTLVVLIASSILLYSISNIFTFPILFRLGYQKGKMWGLYLPMCVLSAVMGGCAILFLFHGQELRIFEFITFVTNHLMLVSVCMILCAILLLALSCMISIRVFSKRNF